MSFINRLNGEEPGFLAKAAHALQGTGHYGEYLADYALDHGKIPGRGRSFTNLYVPYRGRTSEVDVLYLHETGIYVLESKNYSGWIFGSADQRQWTQCLQVGKKERFYSPILQNRSHIKALAGHLALPLESFHSLVVFSERCELKDVPDDTDEFTILRRHHLVREVNRLAAKRPRVFDDAAFDAIAAKLEQLAKTEEKAAEHIETVKGIQDGTVCPYCGGQLVKRNGKYGEFTGCSNYPKCRFTAKG